MSGNDPTDFNDAARAGRDIATDIAADIVAISAARQAQVAQSAERVEGVNPLTDAPGGPPPGTPPPANAARHDEEWRDLLEKGQGGGLKSSVRNVELVLRYDAQWQGVLGFCALSYRVIKRRAPPMADSETGEWAEEDAAALRIWMSHQYGFTPGHGDINDALIVVARSARFHPVVEYLESLTWDGVSRLNTWLAQAFESTDDARYLELVGRRVLIAAVARVMRPGCKMDNVMILEGQQGRGKSTVISVLFGDWFSDSPIPIGDKEAYQLISGKWGYELGELDSFHKAEITALKQFFSQRIDRFRPSYGRYAQDFPRQTQFWGSTNQDVYLRDYSGNRRFWPLYCAAVNLAWVREHRDQLWAEALQAFRQGEKWWVSQETPEDEADYQVVTEAQDARLQRDPWEDLLRPWLAAVARPHLTSAEILKDCIGLDGAHMQQAHMNRLAPIMKSLGWRSTRKRIDDGTGNRVQARIWVSETHAQQLAEVPL